MQTRLKVLVTKKEPKEWGRVNRELGVIQTDKIPMLFSEQTNMCYVEFLLASGRYKSNLSDFDLIEVELKFLKTDKKDVAQEFPETRCPKCGKWCKGRSCHDCQQYW